MLSIRKTLILIKESVLVLILKVRGKAPESFAFIGAYTRPRKPRKAMSGIGICLCRNCDKNFVEALRSKRGDDPTRTYVKLSVLQTQAAHGLSELSIFGFKLGDAVFE